MYSLKTALDIHQWKYASCDMQNTKKQPTKPELRASFIYLFLPLKASRFNSKLVLVFSGFSDFTAQWKTSHYCFPLIQNVQRAAIQNNKMLYSEFEFNSCNKLLLECSTLFCFVGSSKPEQRVLSLLLLSSGEKKKKGI